LSTSSPNLGLTLPEGTDTGTRADYKGNLDKLDAAADISRKLDLHVTRGADGKITKTELKQGATVKRTLNFTRSSNKISTIQRIEGAETILSTINRTDGLISSITKEES